MRFILPYIPLFIAVIPFQAKSGTVQPTDTISGYDLEEFVVSKRKSASAVPDGFYASG